MNYLHVAKPLTLPCGQQIKNRFFKSAMSETMADNHEPDERFARLYGKWSAGGSGIIVTGNVMVDRDALAEPGNVVVDDERSLPLLKEWAKVGTANQTQLWMQLNHPGKQSPKYLSAQPAGPSAIRLRELTANILIHHGHFPMRKYTPLLPNMSERQRLLKKRVLPASDSWGIRLSGQSISITER